MLRIVRASALTVFGENVVGPRVIAPEAFEELIAETAEVEIRSTVGNVSEERIRLPDAAKQMVLGGLGTRMARTTLVDRYFVVNHGGADRIVLRRTFAAPVSAVYAVIRTAEAYANAEGVSADELERVRALDATHVLVDVQVQAKGQMYERIPPMLDCLLRKIASRDPGVSSWGPAEIRSAIRRSRCFWRTVSLVADGPGPTNLDAERRRLEDAAAVEDRWEQAALQIYAHDDRSASAIRRECEALCEELG